MSNERHRLLTLCIELVIVAGIAALMLMSRKKTYESDTSAIAGSIQTPVAIGQGQHGTARWMQRSERQKAFAVYRLDESETQFAALLKAGAQDRKEVQANKDEKGTENIADKSTVKSGADTTADKSGTDAADKTSAIAVSTPQAQTPEVKAAATGK